MTNIENLTEDVARVLWRNAEYRRRLLLGSRFVAKDEDATWCLYESDARAAICAVLDGIRDPDSAMIDHLREKLDD